MNLTSIIVLSIAFLVFTISMYAVYFSRNKKKPESPRQPVPQSDLEAQLRSEVNSLNRRIDELQETIRSLKTTNKSLQQMNRQLEDERFQLKKQIKHIEELQKRKSEIFAQYSHDIKNPAGMIKNIVELLDNYELTVEQQKEMMRNIFNTADKIVKLSIELSKFLVVESPDAKYEFKRHQLAPIVQKVYAESLLNSKKKRQEIKLMVESGLPDVGVDDDKIEEAIRNYVDNAIKFSPLEKQIEMKLFKDGNMVAFEVLDDGPGLPEEDIKNAFKKGGRLSAKPTGGEESTGLGLWVVRKIIEDHRGNVYIKHNPSKGLVFGFRLPVPDDPAWLRNQSGA